MAPHRSLVRNDTILLRSGLIAFDINNEMTAFYSFAPNLRLYFLMRIVY